MKHNRKRRSRVYIVGILILLILAACVFLIVRHIETSKKAYQDSVTIILSPHFDDAVLSLGGLMAEHAHLITVATFFTGVPTNATSTQWDAFSGFKDSTESGVARTKENDNALKLFGATAKNYGYLDNEYGRPESADALEADITQDIQNLIAGYSDKTISIYGPSYFDKTITHPDHQVVHDAFLNVARGYPNQNVHFYLYEDFPYTDQFNKTSIISLQKNLENETGLFLDEENIPLTAIDVSKKINGIKKYPSQVEAFTAEGDDILKHSQQFTSTRCGVQNSQACEVVYLIDTQAY